MRKLEKQQMKNLTGGVVEGGGSVGTWHCACAQHIGAWTYTSTPTAQQRYSDLQAYCRADPGEPLGACYITTN